jgi:hypothetical protein
LLGPSSANGVFGAKIMWGYLGDFAELLCGIDGMAGRPLPELLARAFPGLRGARREYLRALETPEPA